METREAIFTRRAIRRFAPRSLAPETVHRLLQAAVQAPSALNQQPWSFTVLHGRERLTGYSRRAKDHILESLPTAFGADSLPNHYASPAFNIFHDADTLVVINATSGELHAAEDCCLAATCLMLAAWSEGIGSCPIGFARPWLRLAATKQELGIPPHHTPVFPLVLGYPAEVSPPMPRRPPDIVTWQWD